MGDVNERLDYQPEVDGLRAVAVLSVVAFHALPGSVPGGFLGVDIFFVISGYLITNIIWRDLESKRFDLVTFYHRRIRRIMPALCVVLLATTVGVCLLGFSRDIANFGWSLAAAATSLANVLFWREAGYFEAASETKPLLHTWSLGVEEQFYLAYPLVLGLIHRLWPRRRRVVFVLLLVSSLLLALWASVTRPSAAFYLAPFRAWELMLGGALCIASVPPIRTRWTREALATIGWVLLAPPLWWRNDFPFPVPGALPVCLGAALLIHASRSGKTLSSALLASRPLVFIGLVSYSLYLWHWPLLAGAHYLSVRPIGGAVSLSCVVVSFLLAVPSWRFVERPFRSPRPEGQFRHSTVFVVAGLAICALCAAGGVLAHWPPAPHGERAEQLAFPEPPKRLDEIDGAEGDEPGGPEPRTAVWGDSHAAALMPAIEAAAARHGQTVRRFTWGGAPPVVGLRRTNQHKARGNSYAFHEKALRTIESSLSIDTVIIAAFWKPYTSSVELGEGSNRLTEEAAFRVGLETTLARLLNADKRVVLVGPIPTFDVPVPRALGLLAAYGEDPGSFVLPAVTFELDQHRVFGCLDAQHGRGVLRLNPHEALRRGDSFIAINDGRPLYIDTNHLSLAGAALVSPLFDQVFRK